MRRTRGGTIGAEYINYSDPDKKNRWGRLVKEKENYVTVLDVLGEVFRVPKNKIKKRKIRTEKGDL